MPVVDDVAASSPVAAVCVPEAELTGQVVGHSVDVQVSGHRESVRETVEVTVTVVVGGRPDVGGGGGRLLVEVELEIENDEVLTVEVEQVVEVTVEVEVDGEVGDDGELGGDVGVEDDDEDGNDTDVGQGGYNTMVVVAHPFWQAVSQAVVV